MPEARKIFSDRRVKQFLDVRNIPLYIFCVLVLAIAWSGVKTVENNYQLQKHIAELQQQNEVLRLQNENAQLQNKYYATDEYLDLAARQNLGLASPGEKVLLIPKSVALKYVDQSLEEKPKQDVAGNPSKIIRNFEAWRDFLLGRKVSSD